jgi:hypothetical protein
VDDQLGRADRVRNHHEGTHGRIDRADLGHDRADAQRREIQAAVFLRDQEAHEALALHEPEDLLGHALGALDLVAVDQVEQLLDRPVEEGLLLGRQLRVRLREHLLEVGIAAEELAVDPDMAGLQRLPLGVRDLRQDLVGLHPLHHQAEHENTSSLNETSSLFLAGNANVPVHGVLKQL